MDNESVKEPHTLPPNSTSSTDETKAERRARRNKEELEAKMKTKSEKSSSRGSGGSKSSSRDRESRDRDAKQRARRTDSSGPNAARPGAVSSTGEHRSRTKAGKVSKSPPRSSPRVVSSTGEHKSRTKTGSDRGTSSTSRSRDDRKKDRQGPRANTPGAVSSTNDDSKAASKSRKNSGKSSRDKDAKNRNRSNKAASIPGAVQSAASLDKSKPKSSSYLNEEDHAAPNSGGDNPEAFTVFATTADEDEEERRKIMAQKEAQVRREFEARQRQEAQQEEERRAEPPPGRTNNNRKIGYAIICVLLIGAGVGAALFATGSVSSKVVEDNEPQKEVNQTTGSPTFILPITPAPSDLPRSSPSDPPSSPPTWLAYDRPSLDQCASISEGVEVEGQDEMIEKNFLLQLDVDLSSDSEPGVLEESLSTAIQRVVAPKLAGCEDIPATVSSSQGGRNLQGNEEFKYIIGNAAVGSVTKEERFCANRPDLICIRMIVEISIFVKGNDLQSLAYLDRFRDVLNVDSNSVVRELELDPPYVTIRLSTAITLDTTAPPSIARSSRPSSQPSSVPTLTVTESGTFSTSNKPTAATSSPTQTSTEVAAPGPTETPTPRPSLRPSIQPAPGVTPVPTTLPSNRPSLTPSSVPSIPPSKAPSGQPSSTSSLDPSDSPSSAPSDSPSFTPTTMQPSQVPTMCAEPVSTFGPELAGYCVKSNGVDQNSGVIKILDGDFGGNQESKDLCLEACSCYEGEVVTGCEMIRDRASRGCYVHTQEVHHGNGFSGYLCHITPKTCTEPLSTFGPELAGFCVKSNGADQNSGVIKILDGDFGGSQESKDLCLEACSCYHGGVTGCEMIRDRSSRGCYVHTREIHHGNGFDGYLCHIAPTMCTEPISMFGPELAGYCVKSDGVDQNSGVIKILDGDFGGDQENKDLCLEACSCYEGAVVTGCEMIKDRASRGCYVHTQEVHHGNGFDGYLCHKARTICAEALSTFGPELAGYCVKSNGADQNSGVIKILDGDFGGNQESKDLCLEACSCYEGEVVTGCEMIRDRASRGCYVHTQEVHHGNGFSGYLCHITPKTCTEPLSTFGPELAGFCVKSNGADQNSGVIKILDGDFGGSQESKDLCLEACSCYHGGVTGCEMIRDRSSRGCYVHTREIHHGNGFDGYLCHIAPTMCTEPVSTFGAELAGYCVKSDGTDQNSGVIKILDGDFGGDQENKDLCLEACSCYEGEVVTGCEMIRDRASRGCYVHTQEVSRGQGSNTYLCHLAGQ